VEKKAFKAKIGVFEQSDVRVSPRTIKSRVFADRILSERTTVHDA
jgi:hypothetical protein